jgi:hypothetical protein
MAIAQSAKSLVGGSDDSVTGTREQAASLPRSPKQSEIRDLAGVALEEAFDSVGEQRRFEPIAPLPTILHAAVEYYARATQGDSDVLSALQADDLPLAIVRLIHENLELRKDNASWQADFEELRAMNLAQQEESDARFAVADDQRLQSLEQLERTHNDLIELESEYEGARLDYEHELESLREQRDLLQRELGELASSPRQ